MNIKSQKEGTELTFFLEGRIDSVTAPEIQSEVEKRLDGITRLIFDFTAATFLSSAGIRCLLWSEIQIKKQQGTMTLRNLNDLLKEVLVLTGLDTTLNIE